jgi:hypothetical protein
MHKHNLPERLKQNYITSSLYNINKFDISINIMVPGHLPMLFMNKKLET